jgi:hypothetical protein
VHLLAAVVPLSFFSRGARKTLSFLIAAATGACLSAPPSAVQHLDAASTDTLSAVDAGIGASASSFGLLSGSCGVLAAQDFQTASPLALSNAIDFGDRGFDEQRISVGGAEILADGNLGGSSIHSELVSFEVLAACEQAELLKTEGEIAYRNEGGKKTDLLLRIDALTIGVSVTRAYGYPPENPYTYAQAFDLLSGKLSDVLLANANVVAEDVWEKQILHVIAYEAEHAAQILAAFEQVDAVTKADTIVIVTVTDGDDAFIY